jgi:2-phospho-L-lactate guanylyltransferase
MSWTAVIPFKGTGEPKTRLAGALGLAERRKLSARMFARVTEALAGVAQVGEIAVLSDQRPAGWSGRLIADEGRGLNGELTAAAAALGAVPLLVIHADLPLVAAADIEALIAATDLGAAIAPDRLASGTNALALQAATRFSFAFGEDSFALHRKAAGGVARVVSRQGLALDIDTPDDLAAAVAAGFLLEGFPSSSS